MNTAKKQYQVHTAGSTFTISWRTNADTESFFFPLAGNKTLFLEEGPSIAQAQMISITFYSKSVKDKFYVFKAIIFS